MSMYEREPPDSLARRSRVRGARAAADRAVLPRSAKRIATQHNPQEARRGPAPVCVGAAELAPIFRRSDLHRCERAGVDALGSGWQVLQVEVTTLDAHLDRYNIGEVGSARTALFLPQRPAVSRSYLTDTRTPTQWYTRGYTPACARTRINASRRNVCRSSS